MLYKLSFDDGGQINFTPFHCKQFTASGQSEAIVFLNKETLLITNEKGKVYLMSVKMDRRTKEKRNPELEYLFPKANSLEIMGNK